MKENFSKVDEQAREWFVLMQSGTVADAQRQDFDAWLVADEAHQLAYSRYEQLWLDLGDLANTPEATALKRSVADIPLQHGVGAWLGRTAEVLSGLGKYLLNPWSGLAYMTAVMAWIVVFLVPGAPEQAMTEHYQTRVAEVKRLALDDGSEVVLGARSEIRVDFGKSERRVILVQGQAYFAVSNNPARPFLVEMDNTRVTVVGTRFDVRRGQDRISVAVEEGVVQVSASLERGAMTGAIGRPVPVELVAGQKVSRIGQGGFQPVENVPAASVGAWREGRLVYRGAPLKEVVEDANRYYSGTISLESPEIADIEVTASFRAEQAGDLPDLLAGFLPVSVVRDNDNIEIHLKTVRD